MDDSRSEGSSQSWDEDETPVSQGLYEMVLLDTIQANEEVGLRGNISNVLDRGVDVRCTVSVNLPDRLPAVAATVWDLDPARGPMEIDITVAPSGERDIRSLENVGSKVGRQLLQMARDYKGSLGGLIRHLHRRAGELHRYCTVCGREHTDGVLMPVPTVCMRPLCMFAWQSFAKFRDGALGRAQTQRLLRAFFVTAALGGRGIDPAPVVLSADQTPFDLTYEIIKEVAMTLGQRVDKCCDSVCPYCGIDSWILQSNRSLLIEIPDCDQLGKFQTEFQYYIMANPPELEEAFQRHKKAHGSRFYYHGSPTDNWHSIMRNGFYVAQAGQILHGTAHGNGVYVAPNIATSYGSYTRYYSDKKCAERLPEEFAIRVIAVCEVAMSLNVKDNGWCSVVPDAEMIVPRFLLAWDKTSRGPVDCGVDALQDWCRGRMERFS